MPIQGQTQVCAFHLNNRQAGTKLSMTWNYQHLENDSYPKYLGVTLEQTLYFNKHVQYVKAKVAVRNNPPWKKMVALYRRIIAPANRPPCVLSWRRTGRGHWSSSPGIAARDVKSALTSAPLTDFTTLSRQ